MNVVLRIPHFRGLVLAEAIDYPKEADLYRLWRWSMDGRIIGGKIRVRRDNGDTFYTSLLFIVANKTFNQKSEVNKKRTFARVVPFPLH